MGEIRLPSDTVPLDFHKKNCYAKLWQKIDNQCGTPTNLFTYSTLSHKGRAFITTTTTVVIILQWTINLVNAHSDDDDPSSSAVIIKSECAWETTFIVVITVRELEMLRKLR